jgi:hypothetical protein
VQSPCGTIVDQFRSMRRNRQFERFLCIHLGREMVELVGTRYRNLVVQIILRAAPEVCRGSSGGIVVMLSNNNR